MTEQLNIICIFCHVSVYGIDESYQTDSQKNVFKNHINQLFTIALNYIGQTNRLILITEKGAEIAYLGALEDAKLMAHDMVNHVVVSSRQGATPLSVRVGIHLQPMYEIKDFSQNPNLIGNGIRAAKRTMAEAKPNEIIVSSIYTEDVSALNKTISTTLIDQLVKADNHVIDEPVAGLNLTQDIAEHPERVLNLPNNLTSYEHATEKTNASNAQSWKYALASVIMVVSLFLLVEIAIMPVILPGKQVKALPIKAIQSSNLNIAPSKSDISDEPALQANNDNGAGLALPNKLQQTKIDKAFFTKKKVRQKAKKSVNAVANKDKENGQFSWESLKKSLMQGQKKECTQAENALNQCR